MVKTKIKKSAAKKKKYGVSIDGSPITYEDINTVIGAFTTIVPGDFVGRSSAFARPATREAVADFLKRHTVAESLDMIKEYGDRFASGEEFCPSIGRVYEFFTAKLAKIEHFLGRRQQASTRVIPGVKQGNTTASFSNTLEEINKKEYRATRKFYKDMKDKMNLKSFYEKNKDKFNLDDLDDIE